MNFILPRFILSLIHLDVSYKKLYKALITKLTEYDIPDKVAIMGEKLGGWLALKMVQRRPEWFKASIAVNPILNFENYIQVSIFRIRCSIGDTLET